MNNKNRQYWSKKVAEFIKSGKTKEEWCIKKNITIKQFNYWLKQFPEETTETQWLPVEISEQKEKAIPTINPLNIKIGAAGIEVSPGYDKELLLEILTILKTI